MGMDMKQTLCIILWLASALGACAYAAIPPDGFSARFNGNDLSGWWGLRTVVPANWMDAANLRFKNNENANTFIRREYRKGWEVDGLA
jgi:hypothetical protein